MSKQFSFEDKMKCAEREVAMRKQVYAKWQAGKPLTDKQVREIALMAEIAEDYRAAMDRRP